jgi:hypothetical protein
LRASAFLQEKRVIVVVMTILGTYGGQVFMYVSNTVGDLANGSLYMMKEQTTTKEKDMVVGESYLSFVKIENHTTMTGNQINAC